MYWHFSWTCIHHHYMLTCVSTHQYRLINACCTCIHTPETCIRFLCDRTMSYRPLPKSLPALLLLYSKLLCHIWLWCANIHRHDGENTLSLTIYSNATGTNIYALFPVSIGCHWLYYTSDSIDDFIIAHDHITANVFHTFLWHFFTLRFIVLITPKWGQIFVHFTHLNSCLHVYKSLTQTHFFKIYLRVHTQIWTLKFTGGKMQYNLLSLTFKSLLKSI